MSNDITIKRALLSVSDKQGLESIAKCLIKYGVEIISSGGTGKYLSDNDIPWTPVESVTGNPEAFGGRMKTLSFQISSSLLYRRGHEQDEKEAKKLGITPIDLVICNLYPFVDTAKKTQDIDELIEKIDIGGPTMVRAAAKNYKDVTICVDGLDYESLVQEMHAKGGKVGMELRKELALKAFTHTAEYESAIAKTLNERFKADETDKIITLNSSQREELRYGENPHQWAKVVKDEFFENGLAGVTPIQGKKLSYNNLLDADAAFRCTSDLNNVFSDKSVVTIIKHANPCGVSVSSDIALALKKAWAGDPISSFGSIICFSQEVDQKCASFLEDKFVEVLIAPSFSEEAKRAFSKKKNLRIIELPLATNFKNQTMIKSIYGGWVIQEEDCHLDVEFNQVTKNLSVSENIELLTFGSVVTKHLKSNAISLVWKNDDSYSLAGAGMGNPNRLISTVQAIEKAKENKVDLGECTLISDAFFPFRDNVDLSREHGITKIVQPGGSIRDKEVIEACDEHGISMCFTGKRHFRH